MQPLSIKDVRSSFINATRSEIAKLTPPKDFESLDWANLDLLGWRDEKMPLRGYLVVPTGQGPVAVILRAPEGAPRRARMVLCELCRDIHSQEDVLLWVARRAGLPGRNGNTVGTLICADFRCSSNVRKPPPANEINPDPALVVERQTAELRKHAEKFVGRVRHP